MGNALKLSEIAAELARRELLKSRQALSKRPGMSGRVAAAREANATMKKKNVPTTLSEEQTPLYPGEDGFPERAYKENARGPVNIDTIGHEVEKPRIMEAERGDENSIINSMTKKTSKLGGKPQVVGGGLTKDPRVAEQLGKLSMIEQLIERQRAGKAPGGRPPAEDAVTLRKLWEQEKTTYDTLLREVMDEGVR